MQTFVLKYIFSFVSQQYGDPSFSFGYGQDPFIQAGCRVSDCYATHNRSMFDLKEIDAVVWHIRAKDRSLPKIRQILQSNAYIKLLTKEQYKYSNYLIEAFYNHRSPHTFYIFWMIESALYTFTDLKQYKDVFNWTFTYRTDSDFPRM